MSELVFSFTECAPVPQDPQLVIPAAESDGTAVISVRNSGKTAYNFMEKAARRFRGWVTVTTALLVRTVVSRVCAFVRSLLPHGGIQILRQSEILII